MAGILNFLFNFAQNVIPLVCNKNLAIPEVTVSHSWFLQILYTVRIRDFKFLQFIKIYGRSHVNRKKLEVFYIINKKFCTRCIMRHCNYL